jgi:hypothetical protein
VTGRLVNLALYQAGWFACVLGAAHGRPHQGAAAALALTAVHVGLCRDRRGETALVLAAGAVGATVDGAQSAAGVVTFHGGTFLSWLAPLWIVALWMQFATLLRFSLSWLAGRYALAAALGAVGGPLGFAGGARLGAATLHPWPWLSVASFAIVWAAVLPLLLWLASRFGSPASRYSWERGDGGADRSDMPVA